MTTKPTVADQISEAMAKATELYIATLAAIATLRLSILP